MNESKTIEFIIPRKNRSYRDWDSEPFPNAYFKAIHE